MLTKNSYLQRKEPILVNQVFKGHETEVDFQQVN